MMVVPPCVGSNGRAAVGTLPLLPLPEGKQEVTPFEGGSHLCRLTLPEVQLPAGIIGIGPVRNFGMARDRETVGLEKLHGLALSRWSLYFSGEHPVMGTDGGEVAGLHPANAFITQS
jgi:hypothetical protein